MDINGTSGNEVIFTSYRDDSRGGDTNNDGSATSPAKGNWSTVAMATGSNTIDYLNTYYSNNGVYAYNLGTALAINDSLFENNNYSLGVYTRASLTTARNTFYKSTYPPLAHDMEQTSLTLGSGANADILGTGANINGFNAIGLGGVDVTSTVCVSNLCTLSQRNFAGIDNIPYVVAPTSLTLRGTNNIYRFDAGVIVKFNTTPSLFSVYEGAGIDVNGTQLNPVIFTSYRDDNYGGDTNNDGSATSPARNDWGSIQLHNIGVSTIDFAKMKYGNSGLYASNPTITINDTDISNMISYGIQFNNTTSPTMNRVNIENNGGLAGGEYRWGAYNLTASTINALNLFWGATAGPNDADAAGSCGLNVSTGNAVRDTAANPIDYCPYSAVRFNSHHSLLQYKADGTTSLTTGGVNDSSSAVVKMIIDSFSSTGTLTIEVEARPVATAFTNTATHTGNATYSSAPVPGTVTLSSLSDALYHWQSRICDASAVCSTWSSYGANAESATDFQVITNQAPNAPSSLGGTSYVDGSYSSDSTPTLSFTLSDSDIANTVKYEIIIDNSSDFATPLVDYTSALGAQGSTSFTVGQLAGSGTYLTGSSGQTLTDGSYYWKVKAIDNSDVSSVYTTANSGSIAYVIDATAPSIPGTPSTATPTVDLTPIWSWTASTDSGSGLATNTYTVDWCTSSIFTGCGANSDTSTTNSYTHTTDLMDGIWYFRVKGSDVVGNESSYSGNGSVTIDTTIPSVSLTTPSPNPTTDSTPTISGTATDAGSITAVAYQVDSTTGAWTSCVADDGVFDESSETYSCTLSALADGSHTVYVRTTDNVSNNSSNASTTIVIDTTGPTSFSIVSPGNSSYTNNNRPTFKWKMAIDSSAGLSSYRITVDNPNYGDSYSSGDFTISNIPVSGSSTYTTSKYEVNFDNNNNEISLSTKSSVDWGSNENNGELREGKINWKIEAVDALGNTASAPSVLYLDTTSPEIQNLRLNESEIITSSYSSSDFTPTIYGKLVDKLSGGNPDEVQNNEGPKITSGPKNIEISIKRFDGQNYITEVIYTINLSELRYSCDDTIISNSTEWRCDKYSNFQYNSDDPLAPGLYKIIIKGLDNAGNYAERSFDLRLAILTALVTEPEKRIIEETVQEMPKSQQEEIMQNLEITRSNEAPISIDSEPKASLLTRLKSILNLFKNYLSSIFSYRPHIATINLNKPMLFIKNIYSWLSYSTISFKEIVLDHEPTRISNVKVISISNTQARITWTTNHLATTKVNYGETLDYGQDIQFDERTHEHSVTISNLSSNTKYYYEVMSQGKNYVYDAHHEFTTATD